MTTVASFSSYKMNNNFSILQAEVISLRFLINPVSKITITRMCRIIRIPQKHHSFSSFLVPFILFPFVVLLDALGHDARLMIPKSNYSRPPQSQRPSRSPTRTTGFFLSLTIGFYLPSFSSEFAVNPTPRPALTRALTARQVINRRQIHGTPR